MGCLAALGGEELSELEVGAFGVVVMQHQAEHVLGPAVRFVARLVRVEIGAAKGGDGMDRAAASLEPVT